MPTIYILKCKNDCFFIGKTTGSYFTDIDNHFKGNGCEWTKLYKPIRLEILRHFCDETDDDFYTKMYITKYGIDKVRGGSYSQLVLSQQQIDEINHYPIDLHLTCYQCYMKGHKRRLCPFLRNSFDKKDTIEDTDDDKKSNEEAYEDPKDIKNANGTSSFLKNIIHHITYPVKLLLDRLYNHQLNNMLSMRLGRSGSFHRLYPFDVITDKH
jgi:hypothetical protein